MGAEEPHRPGRQLRAGAGDPRLPAEAVGAGPRVQGVVPEDERHAACGGEAGAVFGLGGLVEVRGNVLCGLSG